MISLSALVKISSTNSDLRDSKPTQTRTVGIFLITQWRQDMRSQKARRRIDIDGEPNTDRTSFRGPLEEKGDATGDLGRPRETMGDHKGHQQFFASEAHDETKRSQQETTKASYCG